MKRGGYIPRRTPLRPRRRAVADTSEADVYVGLRRTKRLKPISDKKRKADAMNGVEYGKRSYMAGRTECELTRWLDELEAPGWAEWPKPTWCPEDRKPLEPHHVYGKKHARPHAHWNLLCVAFYAHDYCTGGCNWIVTEDGRKEAAGTNVFGMLACILAKEAAGKFPREAIRSAIGPDPTSFICRPLEDGIFTGQCEAAARDFCRRHGL
jgi:hypothetical protein